MKNFFYAARQVFKLKGSNIIKLLSLTLGLIIGGTFASRVAFEQSWDNFFPDIERLYFLEGHVSVSGNKAYTNKVMAPLVPAIQAAVPGIENSTRLFFYGTMGYAESDRFFDISTIFVDSCFFDVLDFGIISGDPHKALTVYNNAFISEKYAKIIFGDSDPLGQVVLQNDKPITICGVFRTVPLNCHLNFDIAVAPAEFPAGWDGGDSYMGYFKLQPGVDPATIETAIPSVIFANTCIKNTESKPGDMSFKYNLTPVRTVQSRYFVEIDLIMSILAFVLVLVGALNYVLLALSSLSSRAKEVGVHKANGASTTTVFSLILWETFIYIILSLALSVILMISFRTQIEGITGEYSDLFDLMNIWTLGVIIVLLFLVSGIIPAWIFSRIPVSQMFRRYSDNKNSWKRTLLFFQFLSASFIVSFLLIITLQYNKIMTSDLGYNYDNVAYTTMLFGNKKDCMLAAAEVERLPFVREVALANTTPAEGGMSGIGIYSLNKEGLLFLCEHVQVESRFFDLFDIPIVVGQNMNPEIDSSMCVIDHQTAARLATHGYDAIDFKFNGNGTEYTVSGVANPIKLSSFRSNPRPIVYTYFDEWVWSEGNLYLIMKLDTLTAENMKIIYSKLRELFPKHEFKISSYEENLMWTYESERIFRDTVWIASIMLLIITIMGVIGYIATEIRRRAREIAIRKVYGATSSEIVILLLRGIGPLCVVASVVGVVAAYVLSGYWLEQFTVKVDLSWYIFAVGAGLVLLIVIVSVVIRTWNIATSNPIKSIKSE